MKKTFLLIIAVIFVAGCASSSGMKVTIVPTLDKRIKEMSPLPRHVGLFIEPSLRTLSQEERQNCMIAGIHHYIFPIGEPLSKNIEEMAKRVFARVTILNELPGKETAEKEGLDNVLAVRLKASRLELIVEESIWQAIGKHYLSLQVAFFDKNLTKVFEDELSVEGKNLDLIDYETEGGWWKVAGPKYGPSVEDSIEKFVFLLARRLNAEMKPAPTK